MVHSIILLLVTCISWPDALCRENLMFLDMPGRVKNAGSWRDYFSGTLTMMWDPLPSLDLTDIDPDIIYFVELVRITCGQHVPVSHRIVSSSTVTEESLGMMQIYRIRISARNNVREVRNGPSVEIRGEQSSCICEGLSYSTHAQQYFMAEKFLLLDKYTIFALATKSQVNTTVRL